MVSRIECTRVHFVQVTVSVSVSRPKKGLDNNTVNSIIIIIIIIRARFISSRVGLHARMHARTHAHKKKQKQLYPCLLKVNVVRYVYYSISGSMYQR